MNHFSPAEERDTTNRLHSIRYNLYSQSECSDIWHCALHHRLLQSMILEPESQMVIHQALEAIPMQFLEHLSSDSNPEVLWSLWQDCMSLTLFTHTHTQSHLHTHTITLTSTHTQSLSTHNHLHTHNHSHLHNHSPHAHTLSTHTQSLSPSSTHTQSLSHLAPHTHTHSLT